MYLFRLSGFILISAVFLSAPAKAQTGTNISGIFDQFFQNYYMINPASNDSSGKFSVSLGHTALTGLFEGVNRQYFDADFRPGKIDNTSFSRFGLLVVNINDGAFISRSRYYGRYSRTIAIGKEQFISTGVSLGLISYSFRGSQAFAGNSSTAFDANAGLWYIRKQLKVGLSVQQIPRSVLQPIQQTFRLNPTWNFNLVYLFRLTSSVRITNHFYLRKESLYPYYFEYAPVFLLSEVIESGLNFKYRRGVSVMLGLRSLDPGFGKIRFMGSYLISTRELSNTADNKFELSAGYSF